MSRIKRAFYRLFYKKQVFSLAFTTYAPKYGEILIDGYGGKCKSLGKGYYLPTTIQSPFWLSIKRTKNCLFSRRNGYKGKRIFGLSICLRLFGKTIL